MTNISKSILLAGVILMALLCMIGTAAAAEEIREWSDFETVRENSGGEYILMANLDFNEADAEYPDGWIPLGTEDGPFTGKFDGNNGLYTISNLTLNEENYGDAAGFFGYVGEGATLENITLKKAKLTITNEAGPSVIDVSDIGLLAGNFSGTIENCQVDGEIIVYNDGGGAYNIGGLVGCLGDAEITDSSANVNIKITGVNNVYQVAGLIGYTLEACNLENCNATGNIKILSTSYAGDIAGLVGYTSGTSDLENCNATGDITINAPEVSGVGGLVGGGGYNGHMNNS